VSLIKLAALSGIPHATIAGVTTVGVALALTALTRLSGRRFPIRRGQLPFFVLCALLGYVVPFFLQLYAAERVPAGTLALIFSMLPIAAFAFALIAGTDRATAAGCASIGLGIASVMVLLAPDAQASGFGAVDGLLAALAVPLTFGI
jgi:drug/metabolite transporter (DMT)-like permease